MIPVELGIVALATDPTSRQCGVFRTDVVEVIASQGRLAVMAASAHVCVMLARTTSVTDDCPHRVLVPARLWYDTLRLAAGTGAREVKVQTGAMGTTLSFTVGEKSTTLEVPFIEGKLPPIEELSRPTRAPTRRGTPFVVEPRALAKVLKIAAGVLGSDVRLTQTLSDRGIVRFTGKLGETSLMLLLQTPPDAGATAAE